MTREIFLHDPAQKQQHGKSNLIVGAKLHSVQLNMFSVETGELDPDIYP